MPISNFGWQDSPSVATPLDAANLEAFGQSLGAYADAKDLVPTTSQNASGSFQVAPQAFVVLDTTNFGGTSTPLLPNAPVNGTRVAVRWAKGANAVTVQRQGSDVIFAGGSVTATSVALLLGQTIIFQYVNATATWHVIGDVPVTTVTDARMGSGFVQSANVWKDNPAVLAEVEPSATAYTLYVNQANGSDSNKGNSYGQALQTIAKAVNLFHQAGRGGEIVLVGVASGNFDIAAPLSFGVPVYIRAATPSAAALRRTFTTPNSRSVFDAITTVSGGLVTSATAAFTGADVNRILMIYGAGTGGGTYYDFISGQGGTTATFANGTTTIARSPTTEGCGSVKMSVVGDWNRVVTDASITAPAAGTKSVITSATAAWTTDDLGTEFVIAGAGQAHQALRGVITGVSGTTATVAATATFAVSGARCAIGANFGNMLTWWGNRGGQSGLRFVILTDDSVGAVKIGSAINIIAPDMGAGFQSNPADFSFEVGTITSLSDAAGAWEHCIDTDGSWNQATAGPGTRRATFHGFKIFGARIPGETVRLASATHYSFTGNGLVGTSPTVISAGYRVLDPLKTATGQVSTSEIMFVNCEGIGGYLYMEGQKCSYIGGSIAAAFGVTGRRVIELGPAADHCVVYTNNNSGLVGSGSPVLTTTNVDEYDAGTNNRIETFNNRQRLLRAYDQVYSGPTVTGISTTKGLETISRRTFVNASQALGSSGVLVLMSLFMPAGFPFSTIQFAGGGTPLAWGSGWTGPHFIYGVYDPAGQLYAQSNDTGGTQTFNNSFNNNLLAITKDGSGTTISSTRAPLTGLQWVALLVNSGTGGSAFTFPTFAGFTSGFGGTSPALCGTSGAAQTSLPPSVSIPPTSSSSLLYCVVA